MIITLYKTLSIIDIKLFLIDFKNSNTLQILH